MAAPSTRCGGRREATAALAERVGIDLSGAREGPLDAREIRMLLLAEMTTEFAAENALNRKIAVSRRWRVFSDDELEVLEQGFGSYDPMEPLYAEVLAEIERRTDVSWAASLTPAFRVDAPESAWHEVLAT